MTNWLQRPSHHAWLEGHATDLLSFARSSPTADRGARWLDDRGRPLASEPIHTYITARMTYVYALGALLGVPGCGPLAAAAMSGLTGPLRDERHGGWHPSVGESGPAAGKSCYDHVFVVLASAAAVHAGLAGAEALFEDACDVLLERFWDEHAGLCRDHFDRAFDHLDNYRGLNANMHALEAMLAAASVTDEQGWLERARRIADLVTSTAAATAHRLPEHYDDSWRPLLDYNRDRPDDPFKPFGATVGHGFEWARLLVHLANAPGTHDADGLIVTARALFDRAASDGWAPDGRPGFVYTTDWDGRPVVADRFHWVVAEAIGAAAVLYQHTGNDRYAALYRRWWDYAATHLLDAEHGSWRHQLDDHNRPTDTVWHGKPDVYHAFQAVLLPRLPRYPMAAAALAAPREG